MIKRVELETPRTASEFEAILGRFEKRSTIPDAAVHLRQGIAKLMLEEYIPLYRLLQHVRGVSAHLAPDSNNGPDGFIACPSGEIVSVQITTAGYGRNEALGGELMAQGKPCWTGLTRTTERVKGVRRIVESGRAFMKPETRTQILVDAVKKAVCDKINAYRANTDVLLVSGEMGLHNPVWKSEVEEFIRSIENNPYKHIFVGDTKEIYVSCARHLAPL